MHRAQCALCTNLFSSPKLPVVPEELRPESLVRTCQLLFAPPVFILIGIRRPKEHNQGFHFPFGDLKNSDSVKRYALMTKISQASRRTLGDFGHQAITFDCVGIFLIPKRKMKALIVLFRSPYSDQDEYGMKGNKSI